MYHQLHCSHVQDGYTPGACFPSLYCPGVLFSPDISLPLLWGVSQAFSRHLSLLLQWMTLLPVLEKMESRIPGFPAVGLVPVCP